MKNKCISIRRLKVHEFDTTLRKLNRESNTWTGRYEILLNLEKKATRQFIKIYGQIVLAYLIITSLRSGDTLKVKIQSFELDIPLSYFLATTGVLFLISAISLCHLSVALTLKAREGGRVLISGFSANIYGLLQGNENDASLGISMFSNYFIKEIMPVSTMFALAFFFAFIAMLIPFGAIGYYFLTIQLDLLFTPGVTAPQKFSMVFGGLSIILSFIYTFLFHIPLPVEKNKGLIRWIFLNHLSKNRHPMADKWLKDN
ncbi:hypothetical protein [Oceaniglobus trochenteri]|uniref:hypothetical protein n=1 Tax=Oceaniglobus trochenteri TaxID=2763260 RepID=UPI001CFFA9B8|nr:hypothetical protein [Oceaniglobus trochenteri]